MRNPNLLKSPTTFYVSIRRNLKSSNFCMPRLRIQIAEVYVENEPYKEPNSVGDGLSKVFLKMIGL